MRRPRVLLDANVLVNAQVRNLFLTAAEFELIEVYWSTDILAETRRVLLTRLHRTTTEADRFLDALREFFPLALVSGYQGLTEEFVLPDRDDRHVLAAAVSAECDLLVTFNTRDFPGAVTDLLGLPVLTPDDAIVRMDADFANRLVDVVRTMQRRLRNPPMTLEALLTTLGEHAPTGATAIRRRIESSKPIW